MRQLLIISLALLSVSLNAQTKNRHRGKRQAVDTAYYTIPLHQANYAKTLIIEIGKKASIHLSSDSIVNEATRYLNIDCAKDNYIRILNFIDSAFRKCDTASIESYGSFPELEHLVSEQLQKGNAKVFYKKQNHFAETILNRRERFGGHLDRFFYFTDRRPFFGVMEFTGIIDYSLNEFRNYFQEYEKEGEKFASIPRE